MPRRPCLDCGGLFTPHRGQNTPRCPDCARPVEHAATVAKRKRRPYGAAERRRRADAVQRWREIHGDWCPGWGVAPHSSLDLTADHVHPVAAGGSEAGALGILCRRCNGRKRWEAPAG